MTMVRYCFNENRWTYYSCLYIFAYYIILIIINAEDIFFLQNSVMVFLSFIFFFYLNDNNTVKISTCIILFSYTVYYAT